jgi:hypothetical protein
MNFDFLFHLPALYVEAAPINNQSAARNVAWILFCANKN